LGWIVIVWFREEAHELIKRGFRKMFSPIVGLIKKFAPQLEAEAVKEIVNLGEPELIKFLAEKCPEIAEADRATIAKVIATELETRLGALVAQVAQNGGKPA
jgi:hypothetical protein